MATAQVPVVGEKNPDNAREFIWTVTNESDQAITNFEAPHFYGKLFTPPEGWMIEEMTGNVGQGAKPTPGIVRAKADSRLTAIRRGQSRVFALRLDPRGGHFARGKITIGFADGSSQAVLDVLCPAKPPFLQNYFPAIGLGVMFALFLGGKVLLDRRRKRHADASAPT